MTEAAFIATDEATGWVARAGRWNRRISILAALITAVVVLLFAWALAIRFGGWFGVFLGWWPAMLIASAAAFLVGRAWPALALIAAAALLAGGPAVVAGNAAAATKTVIAFVGNHGQPAERAVAQRAAATKPA